MRLLVISGTSVALYLSGCNKPSDGSFAGSAYHGRYAGVGIYPAGQMWSQMVTGASKDQGTSKLGDDEQVIVVVDSNTGELRECGNLTGYCVGMQPWAKALATSQNAPIVVVKHADQLARDAEAAAKTK